MNLFLINLNRKYGILVNLNETSCSKKSDL